MEEQHISHAGPARQAYYLLKFAFVVIPIAAGLDKFFNLLTHWTMYLSPFAQKVVGGHGDGLMMVVGVVEVIAGLGVLLKPRLFSYIVALWLLVIIANLIDLQNYYDIAARDFGLFIAALALGRLSKVYAK